MSYQFVAFEPLLLPSKFTCPERQQQAQALKQHSFKTRRLFNAASLGGACAECNMHKSFAMIYYDISTMSYVRLCEGCADPASYPQDQLEGIKSAVHKARIEHLKKRKVDQILHAAGLDGIWEILEDTRDIPEHYKIRNVMNTVTELGRITAAQTSFLTDLLNMVQRVDGKLPSGKVKIEGLVTAVKTGIKKQGVNSIPFVKVLIKTTEGWSVFGKMPRRVQGVKLGDKIRLTAVVSASKDDPNFGFFKYASDCYLQHL